MFRYVFSLFGERIWYDGLILTEGKEYNIFVFLLMILGVAVEAYLLGAFNTADLISKKIYKTDIRTKGSGNAGATNMMRNFGVGPAVATLCGDMVKTMLAMVVGTLVLGINGAYIAGLFAVLGHVAPVYYKFKGGKGVATTAMIILYLDLKVFVLELLVFVLLVWVTKYLSLGSVIGVLFFPLLANRNDIVPYDRPLRLLISLAIAFIVVFMHRENIKRIMNGNENKFSFVKTKKNKEAPEKTEEETSDGNDEEEDDEGEETSESETEEENRPCPAKKKQKNKKLKKN